MQLPRALPDGRKTGFSGTVLRLYMEHQLAGQPLPGETDAELDAKP